ncbi:MAG: hypothetical protein QF415_12530 [Candidatus Undinarchaeales archaeon]|nr:hypothetical protein [Candidatus Undinarchaeales archaeon]
MTRSMVAPLSWGDPHPVKWTLSLHRLLFLAIILLLTLSSAARPETVRTDWGFELAGNKIVHVVQVVNITSPERSGFLDVADITVPFPMEEATLVAYDLEGVLNATVEPFLEGYTTSLVLREPLFPDHYLVMATEYDVPIELEDESGGWLFSGLVATGSLGEVRFDMPSGVPDDFATFDDRVVDYNASSLLLIHPIGIEPNITLGTGLRITFVGIERELAFHLKWTPPVGSVVVPVATSTPSPPSATCSIEDGATCETSDACACGVGGTCDIGDSRADSRGCVLTDDGCDPTKGQSCMNSTMCACPEGYSCESNDTRADPRGCFERRCDDAVCDVALHECELGCSECTWLDCHEDTRCNLAAKENCTNTPEQCACPEGWTCDPGNVFATDKGCFSGECGDGSCDKDGGECAAGCPDCSADDCRGDGDCSKGVGEDCKNSVDCRCPEGMTCDSEKRACIASIRARGWLTTDLNDITVSVLKGDSERISFDLKNTGDEAVSASILLSGDVRGMVSLENAAIEVPPGESVTVEMVVEAGENATTGVVKGAVNVRATYGARSLVLSFTITVLDESATGDTGAGMMSGVPLVAIIVVSALLILGVAARRMHATGKGRSSTAAAVSMPGATYEAQRPAYYYPRQSYYSNYRMYQGR